MVFCSVKNSSLFYPFHYKIACHPFACAFYHDIHPQFPFLILTRFLKYPSGVVKDIRIEWEYEPKDKKNICTSRSFGKLTNDYSIIKEAAGNYAASCAEKLRKQHSVCKSVHVFISTNPHKLDHPQFHHAITIQCETATNLTSEIIGYALQALEIIFPAGNFLFMKCGVMVLNIIPENEVQINMFDQKSRAKEKLLLSAMDKINLQMGKGRLRMAVQRFDKRYGLKAAYLSRKYTTRLEEVLTIKI